MSAVFKNVQTMKFFLGKELLKNTTGFYFFIFVWFSCSEIIIAKSKIKSASSQLPQNQIHSFQHLLLSQQFSNLKYPRAEFSTDQHDTKGQHHLSFLQPVLL